MKNIHVIPTDKPSRLHLGDNGNLILGLMKNSIESKNNDFTNQNIYITSDEEVNKTDYVIVSCSEADIEEVNLVTEYYNEQFLFDDRTQIHMDYCKKVILTTDLDLIKDGVQAIDDEFLEWFVKNPNCEYVEIENIYDKFLNGDKRSVSDFRNKYKIIIPKEEPKIKCYCGHTSYCDCGPLELKQETLEEAAEKWYDSTEENKGFPKIEAFKDGVKWQAERSYSEEEVGELLYNVIGEYGKHYGVMIDGKMLNDLFEQFKKK